MAAREVAIVQRKQHIIVCGLLFLTVFFLFPRNVNAKVNQRINARSAILIDMESGCVLYEQNADSPIPPASITKVLTLYLVFEAIKEGQVHLWDQVEISSRAAATGGSRMGLRARTRVPLEELIKGMAVVSGNDACVAAAEHISGNVERFVRKMNAKARDLGMTNSRFMTPNGLPASGQLTTARDISKLSIAYLRRFPESLTIHSMQSYSYGKNSHHNANRLLGKCPGVDGLKTGFVCASGYNISATAKRNGTRVLAVVMGARTPWIRYTETEKLIEAGFRECGAPYSETRYAAAADSVQASPVTAKISGKACKLKQAKVRNRLVRSTTAVKKEASHSKGTAKLTKTSVKSKKNVAKGKTVAAKPAKSTASFKQKQNKNSRNVARAASGKSKAASAKEVKSNTRDNSQKSVKSAKKSQPKLTGKKTQPKPIPHANAVKKKANG